MNCLQGFFCWGRLKYSLENAFCENILTTFAEKMFVHMRNLFLLFPLLCCLLACRHDDSSFVLRGTLAHLGSDTLLVLNEFTAEYRLDTIVAGNGQFTYRAEIDTLTPLSLLIDGKFVYPVYADKGQESTMTGDMADLSSFRVEGGVHNEDLNRFNDSIRGMSDADSIRLFAKGFISRHPASYANLHLLQRYFVAEDSVNYQEVVDIIGQMEGSIQDLLYVQRLGKQAKAYKGSTLKYMPSFSLASQDGSIVMSSVFRRKVLLLYFWATWDKDSMERMAMFKRIYARFGKKEGFKMLGVSFDVDKKAWEEAIEKDSLMWQQALEMEGFDSDIARNFKVERLPFYFVTDVENRIHGFNQGEEELCRQIEEFLKPVKKTK